MSTVKSQIKDNKDKTKDNEKIIEQEDIRKNKKQNKKPRITSGLFIFRHKLQLCFFQSRSSAYNF